jgi:NTE family protein
MEKSKSVSLVLSSGGARGMAHIGAIEVLEERGYKIAEISGCSVGALVGGIYATGKLPEFKDWICNLGRINVFGLMDFAFSSKGFIKGDKVFMEIKKIIDEYQIEELNIPFSCNAVDYINGEERIFKSGSLFTAIRASVSIPTMVQPAHLDGNEYIDGGVLNPLPVEHLRHSEHNIVMAVNLNAAESIFVLPPNIDHQGRSMLKFPIWMSEYRRKMGSFFEEEKKNPKSKSLGSLDLLNRSFELMHDKLSRMTLAMNPVDVLVEVSKRQARSMEFYRAAELIEIGRIKTEEALDKLENAGK